MKKLFIIANWKSNKTKEDALAWIQEIAVLQEQLVHAENKKIIICPSFPFLSDVKLASQSQTLPFHIGAQDVSSFAEGSHTGEVNGKQVKEFAEYVILGHSERRQQLQETDVLLLEKCKRAKQHNLKIIYCIQDKTTTIPEGVDVIAYEPVFAIGTENPDTPENANEVARVVKSQNHVQYVLYGGSVDSKNVHSFTSMEHLDGVLVGKASLLAKEFIQIVTNA